MSITSEVYSVIERELAVTKSDIGVSLSKYTKKQINEALNSLGKKKKVQFTGGMWRVNKGTFHDLLTSNIWNSSVLAA